MTDRSPSQRRSKASPQARRSQTRYAIPATALRSVVEIATESGGVDASQLLRGSRVTRSILEAPDLRVPARDAARIVMRAYDLSGNRGLGYEFGLRAHPAAYDAIGYGAMSCATLRDALSLVARYIYLRQEDIALKITEESGQVIIEARDTHDVGPLRNFIHEALMVGFWRMVGFMLGIPRIDAEIHYEWAEPDYHAVFRARLPTVRFKQASTQLRLPAKYLAQRLVMAEPSAAKKAVAQLESEMTAAAPAVERLLDRVRSELRPAADGYPDLESVASRLFLSGRTLKRKLMERNTSFQNLLDEVRYRDARRLLKNPELSIQRIASLLGYNDPPSFTRAFKRWSGQPPRKARRKKRE